MNIPLPIEPLRSFVLNKECFPLSPWLTQPRPDDINIFYEPFAAGANNQERHDQWITCKTSRSDQILIAILLIAIIIIIWSPKILHPYRPLLVMV